MCFVLSCYVMFGTTGPGSARVILTPWLCGAVLSVCTVQGQGKKYTEQGIIETLALCCCAKCNRARVTLTPWLCAVVLSVLYSRVRVIFTPCLALCCSVKCTVQQGQGNIYPLALCCCVSVLYSRVRVILTPRLCAALLSALYSRDRVKFNSNPFALCCCMC
jgi:hypothetical protein